jgi:hypothetical protein
MKALKTKFANDRLVEKKSVPKSFPRGLARIEQ